MWSISPVCEERLSAPPHERTAGRTHIASADWGKDFEITKWMITSCKVIDTAPIRLSAKTKRGVCRVSALCGVRQPARKDRSRARTGTSRLGWGGPPRAPR
jgi:hypothetical protein